MPLPGMEALPLDAPVISLARFFVGGGDDHVEFQRELDKSRLEVMNATEPYKMADGWRCDAEPGKQEALVITGWAIAKAHGDSTAKASMLDPEYGSLEKLSDGCEVRHMVNMET